MINLLDAGFTKLFKSFVYRLTALFCLLYSLFLIVTRIIDSITYPDLPRSTLDGIISSGPVMLQLIVPVFISLFIGREYSDQTMRNKISVGHSRTDIYFSNLIISVVGTLILFVIYVIPIFISGNTYFPSFETPIEKLVCVQLIGMAIMIAVASLYNMIAILIPNKAVTAVLSLLAAFVIFMFGILVHVSLEEDRVARGEVERDYSVIVEESGEVYTSDSVLTDSERKVFEFVDVTLPSSQIVNLSDSSIPDEWKKMVVSNIVITVLTSAAGIIVFRRKDLK